MELDAQARSKLGSALRNFDTWAQGRGGKKRYNPLEPWVKEYPHWDKLGAAFVFFLESRPPDLWNERDIALAHKAVLTDWAHHRLLRSVPDETVARLALQDFPDEAVRMHLQAKSRNIADVTVRIFVLEHFYENDPSESLRDEAVQSLIKNKWDKTEQCVKEWWQTGDESKQLTVLKALSDAKSPLLNEYMEKVAKSDNPSLQKVAPD